LGYYATLCFGKRKCVNLKESFYKILSRRLKMEKRAVKEELEKIKKAK